MMLLVVPICFDTNLGVVSNNLDREQIGSTRVVFIQDSL